MRRLGEILGLGGEFSVDDLKAAIRQLNERPGDRRLAPYREALAAAEAEYGDESPEYDAALSALMGAQA